MPDSKSPPPLRAASRADTSTTSSDGEVTRRVENARVLWDARRPMLLQLDPKAVAPLPGNLQLAAVAGLRVATWCGDRSRRAHFELLASVGLFDLAHLDRLDEAATLALYASSRYKTLKSLRSSARLSADFDADSKALRDRMFSCAEHTLDDVPAAVRVIDKVRPGAGHLDRANDLVALADLYREHPTVVRLDGKKFREGDEEAALAAAEAIFRALGVDAKSSGTHWRDLQHRAWVNLATRYREVRRWGVALFADEGPDALFPDLVAASRSPRDAASKDEDDGEEPDAPSDEPVTPA